MPGNLSSIIGAQRKFLKLTKMVCTIGPASNSVENLVRLLAAGMNVCRLNFSHGSHEMHYKQLTSIREAIASNQLFENTAIMLDTKGPEIRTGNLAKADQCIALKKGQKIGLTTDYSYLGNEETIAVSYSELYDSVKVNSRILIADGNLTLRVVEKNPSNKTVIAEIQNDFLLGERKNVNLPAVKVRIPVITEKDRVDLLDFGLKHQVDFIALSFTTTADCVKLCRQVVGKHIKIIAKIENQEGLENANEIIKSADGIMIARGDMGMEMDPAKLFLAQTYLVESAIRHKKPVIMATQMMESMVYNQRPTRAEITDVACAVAFLNDCTMLSGETGGGHFPIEAANTMLDISLETEGACDYESSFIQSLRSKASETKRKKTKPTSISLNKSHKDLFQSLAESAVMMSFKWPVKMIICLGMTDTIVREISALRPSVPILFFHHNQQILRGLQLCFGVYGIKTDGKKVLSEHEMYARASELFSLSGIKTPVDDYLFVDGNLMTIKIVEISHSS